MSFISIKFVFLFSIIDSQIDILMISETKLGKFHFFSDKLQGTFFEVIAAKSI